MCCATRKYRKYPRFFLKSYGDFGFADVDVDIIANMEMNYFMQNWH